MPAGKTYTPLATTTLNSAAASVTFSNISQAYTDLILVSSIRGATTTIDTQMIFNGDNGSNYSATRLYGDGITPGSNRSTNRAFIDVNYSGSVTTIAPITSVIHIMNYANTTTYKTTLMRSADVGGTYQGTNLIAGMWRGSTGSATQAITSITVKGTGDMGATSTFTLYGILAA